eukprot:TRINITY_DN8588_c0_g5_i6.p1 TRINITY_DN8588_c0_g5~~TRINITY_DN8588_c0_g5_i6.p1  ORF type:complete len:1353 (+),score=272.51 TRINITY_DN8588_c0_g5_i6:78-4061(+)
MAALSDSSEGDAGSPVAVPASPVAAAPAAPADPAAPAAPASPRACWPPSTRPPPPLPPGATAATDADVPLWPYQRELFEMVITNICSRMGTVVICPTGSGKTRVAIAVAGWYLRCLRNEVAADWLRPGAIVFLVPTVALVKQQADQFRDLLPWAEVTEHHGKSKQRVAEGVSNHGIVVSEAQTFSNALNQKVSMNDVAIVFLDEVHHAVATKGSSAHPYAQVLECYTKPYDHDSRRGSALPAVVGLSASPCVGPVDPHQKLRELLSVVSGPQGKPARVASVHRQVASLKARVPEVCVEPAVVRFWDLEAAISEVVVAAMSQTEARLMQEPALLPSLHSTLKKKSNLQLRPQLFENAAMNKQATFGARHTGPYLCFVADQRDSAEQVCRWDIATHYAVLEALCTALQALEDCGGDFCIDVLQRLQDRCKRKPDSCSSCRCDNCLRWEPTCAADEIYANALERVDSIVRRAEPQHRQGSKLARLMEQLRRFNGEVDAQPEQRAILFVYSRWSAAQVLCKIRQLSDLQHLSGDNCDLLVGNSKRNKAATADMPCDDPAVLKRANQGQKSKEQDRQLERLRTGELKLLVATSVAEEGVDVPACNLVIRYDTTFGVAAVIQARGRARALESKFCLIMRPADEDGWERQSEGERLMQVAVAEEQARHQEEDPSYGKPRWWYLPDRFFQQWWRCQGYRSTWKWLVTTSDCSGRRQAYLTVDANPVDGLPECFRCAPDTVEWKGVGKSDQEAVRDVARQVLSTLSHDYQLDALGPDDIALDPRVRPPKPVRVHLAGSCPQLPAFVLGGHRPRQRTFSLPWPYDTTPYQDLSQVYRKLTGAPLPQPQYQFRNEVLAADGRRRAGRIRVVLGNGETGALPLNLQQDRQSIAFDEDGGVTQERAKEIVLNQACLDVLNRLNDSRVPRHEYVNPDPGDDDAGMWTADSIAGDVMRLTEEALHEQQQQLLQQDAQSRAVPSSVAQSEGSGPSAALPPAAHAGVQQQQQLQQQAQSGRVPSSVAQSEGSGPSAALPPAAHAGVQQQQQQQQAQSGRVPSSVAQSEGSGPSAALPPAAHADAGPSGGGGGPQGAAPAPAAAAPSRSSPWSLSGSSRDPPDGGELCPSAAGSGGGGGPPSSVARSSVSGSAPQPAPAAGSACGTAAPCEAPGSGPSRRASEVVTVELPQPAPRPRGAAAPAAPPPRVSPVPPAPVVAESVRSGAHPTPPPSEYASSVYSMSSVATSATAGNRWLLALERRLEVLGHDMQCVDFRETEVRGEFVCHPRVNVGKLRGLARDWRDVPKPTHSRLYPKLSQAKDRAAKRVFCFIGEILGLEDSADGP